MTQQPEQAAQTDNDSDVDPFTVFDPNRLEADLRSMTRIVLRPIGSPMPLGFFTVAIDSVLVSALQWGILPQSSMQAVALIVFPAFVVQVIVGVFAFLGRDSIAATLMMSFATTWLIDAIVFYLHPLGASEALGIFFIVFAAFASLMLASALPKRALAAVIVIAVPRFLIAGVAEITGSRPVAQAAAVFGFLLAAVALYTAFALLLEDSRSQEILPIGRLGPARHATHGNLAAQLRNIERQPGVRRTL
jgi:succinate-acetate transporter protein